MITTSPVSKKESIPLLVKIRDVASLLSVSRHTVHNLVDSGDLKAAIINPGVKYERQHMRITRDSLLRFYKDRFGHSLNRALANPFEP